MAPHKTRYQRTAEELENVAARFWPEEISQKEADLSIIPTLLKTQEQFITIIKLETQNLEGLFSVIDSSALSANLFLKHLVILADFGGEPLNRVSKQHTFYTLFPNRTLNYYWQEELRTYTFKIIPGRQFSNSALKINGKSLPISYSLSDLMKDAVALLLFGNAYSSLADDKDIAAALTKCEIGDYLGKPKELEDFIRQRYIWVSRITGGAQANNLGQLAQSFVINYIRENLEVFGVAIHSNSRLPNVTHTDEATGRTTAFDLIVTNTFKYVAIEVSFQVTTNSTFERKGRQARSRFEQVEQVGHKIAYVIGGAGNLERRSALQDICTHSHCTVSFSVDELNLLCEFLREYFTDQSE